VSDYGSPLPLPAPVDDLTPLNVMLMAAANATGAAKPEIVAGAAQSAQTATQAATNAQAMGQFDNMSAVSKQLSGESQGNQLDAWKQYSPSEQAQLKAAGYKPPGSSPGLLGQIGNAVGAAASFAANRAAPDVLNALGSPLRFVQHAARTAGEALGPSQGALGNTAAFNLSPSEWVREWNETSNGTKYVDPSFQRQAVEKFGQGPYQLAMKLVTSGGSGYDGAVNAVITQTPAAQQQALELQLRQDPTIQAAYNWLRMGQMTLGRGVTLALFGAGKGDVGFQSKVSGAIDAVIDFFGDPAVIGAKASAGWKAGKYLVHDMSDVDVLFDHSASVRAAASDVAAHVAATLNGEDAVGSLLRRYPSLRGAIPELMAARADTEDKVRQFFKDVAGTKALLEGNPIASRGLAGVYLPQLTRAGTMRLAAKGTLSKAIDWLADTPARVEGIRPEDILDHPLAAKGVANSLKTGTGRFLRMALTQSPQGRIFNPNAENALSNLSDIALWYLPRGTVDHVLSEFARSPDLGAKFKIYHSLIVQMGKVAGLDADPDAWNEFIDKVASTSGRVYGPKGLDLVNVNGTQIHAGILDGDLSEGWFMPRFKDMYVAAKKTGLGQATTRAINKEWMNTFMGFWQPLVLARLGFATRVGGEEAANFILRNGVVSYMRARAGAWAVKVATRDAAPEMADLDDVEDVKAAHLWNRLTSHLPSSVTDRITNTRDMVREFMVDAVTRAVGSKALGSDRYRNAIDALIDHGGFDHDPEGLFNMVTANHGYDLPQKAGDFGSMSTADIKKFEGRFSNAELKGSGEWGLYQGGNQYYMHMLHSVLGNIASSDWARPALLGMKYAGNTGRRINEVADVLEAHPLWSKSILSTMDHAGRSVALGEITARQAAQDHANAIVRFVDAYVRSGTTGKVLQMDESTDLATYLLRHGEAPPLPALENIPFEDLPKDVRGPEFVPRLPDGASRWLGKKTDWLFKKVIGPQINWLSRQPMWVHNYAVSREAVENLMATHWADMDDEVREGYVHELAQRRAIDMTMPYVHNPELRSQMSLITRNLAPFWFAQEQFYKRWARAFYYSPAAIRRAQLINSGINNSGLVQTDPEDGQSYFVYPGSVLAQNTIARALSVFGVNAQIPVDAGLVGYTNMLNPGLERIGLPNFGPLLVVPLDGIKSIDPHFTGAIDTLVGSQSASSGYLEAVLPPTLYRLAQFAASFQGGGPSGEPSSSLTSQYASAQMDAIAYLEATGNGMAEPAVTRVGTGAPPKTGRGYQSGDYFDDNNIFWVLQPGGQWQRDDAKAQQTYLDRVKNWSRIFLLTKMLFGFAAPAAPESQFNPGGMHNELEDLLNTMPFNEAMATYMQLYPGATAETVFQTQDAGGSTIPATAAAMSFLQANPGLEKNYSDAATYFIPAPDTSGKFDLAAYQEQLANGTRTQKMPEDYWQQVTYDQAANIYYKVAAYKNQQIAAGGDSKGIDDAWLAWSEQFLAANPIFRVLNTDTGETTRDQIMTDVGAAIHSGAAPANPQTAALATLYDSWSAWQSATENYGNPNAPVINTAQARGYSQQFAIWLSNFEQKFPGTVPLIQRAIAPALSSTIDEMAANGVSVTL
jgi:hypothetical protein